MKKPIKRNERKWLENGDLVILAKHVQATDVTTDTPVIVVGLSGETQEGEVIYDVEELHTRQRYPASERHLRRLKQGEREAIVADQRQRAGGA